MIIYHCVRGKHHTLIIHDLKFHNNIKGSVCLPVERKGSNKREYYRIYIAAMHFIYSGELPLKFCRRAYE